MSVYLPSSSSTDVTLAYLQARYPTNATLASEVATLTTAIQAVPTIGTYSSGTTYAIGDNVTYNDVLYNSIANGNVGNQPDIVGSTTESLYALTDVLAPTTTEFSQTYDYSCHFTPVVSGTKLTAVRIYHIAGDTGSYVKVWQVLPGFASATLLGTYTNTAAGDATSHWQDIAVSPAIALTSGTTYSVSSAANSTMYVQTPPAYHATTLFTPTLVSGCKRLDDSL